MRKLDDKEKRKKFPLWLSPGERLLLEAKATEYGYIYLADYIRDASIYESLVKIDLVGSENLLPLYEEYTKEVRKYTKEVRRILRYATILKADEKELLQKSLYAIYNEMKTLTKTTTEKLDYEIIEKLAKQEIDNQNYDSDYIQLLPFNQKEIFEKLANFMEKELLWEGTLSQLLDALHIDIKSNVLLRMLNHNINLLEKEHKIIFTKKQTTKGKEIELRLKYINNKQKE